MKNNVLTYAEYQKRLKELKTPEEHKDETPAETPHKRILLPKDKMSANRRLQLADANIIRW